MIPPNDCQGERGEGWAIGGDGGFGNGDIWIRNSGKNLWKALEPVLTKYYGDIRTANITKRITYT